ncbi:polysaccharide deacetylase [Halohasta litchfieldiae]|jgi:hypothetical protein|uniref:Polysaccharide deacetylase n=1 Tax=Halohasta litchfieldiae TaxID=1073996 RepID=A0A1H6Y8K7_9EURY|nr:polysaccharide deacetylase family protein [Halohasta litchfieldiae]ATW89212.1 polysaccharide deacetylase [Halohasta litchfieldiae]SEJ37613.1 Polysaccharide deacetylase [Halohasta litchfieldiae]
MSKSNATVLSKANQDDQKTACITLDLESDWFVDQPGHSYRSVEYLQSYIEMIRQVDVPVTVFVSGRLLEDRPEAVERLRRELDTEFHLHSYAHDPEMKQGFRTDLKQGIDAYEAFFGSRPRAYRAPLGKLTPSQLTILDDAGFDIDSSVFPSVRPGTYNNLGAPIEPYQPPETSDLVEFPIGVIPRLRIPAAQSYLKLGGWPYLRLLSMVDLPDPLVFVSHLHDFFDSGVNEYRSQPMKAIQERNLDASTTLFAELISCLDRQGYRFATIADVYDDHINGGLL